MGTGRFSGPGDTVRTLFHCVLVDEYQDTNALQADIFIFYTIDPGIGNPG